RKADREVVGDRRRVSAHVVQEREDRAEMPAEPVLGACALRGGEECQQRQTANQEPTRSDRTHHQRPFIGAFAARCGPAGNPAGMVVSPGEPSGLEATVNLQITGCAVQTVEYPQMPAATRTV